MARRRGKYYLINDSKDLTNSILQFNAEPEFHVKALGRNPVYFPFININGTYLFSLSKYAAFNNVLLEDYVFDARYSTHGSKTQKLISSIIGRDWGPVNTFSKKVQKAFEDWIEPLVGFYKPNKYYLIEVELTDLTAFKRPDRKISPEKLLDQLEKQRKTGMIGEIIALQYEKDRLVSRGCIDLKKHIIHMSKINAGAGYDISSHYKKEKRYIEVKTTTRKQKEFYLTSNEFKVLKNFKNEAYLYIVSVLDQKNKTGEIIEIRNPIVWMTKNAEVTTQIFKVAIK